MGECGSAPWASRVGGIGTRSRIPLLAREAARLAGRRQRRGGLAYAGLCAAGNRFAGLTLELVQQTGTLHRRQRNLVDHARVHPLGVNTP
jgi:hypothetical protein